MMILVYNRSYKQQRLGGVTMELKVNFNAINQIYKGSDIFIEGNPVNSIAMIVKGRVEIRNKGAKMYVGSGTFLGINDLYAGRYLSTYTACDDLLIYIYSINNTEELEQILSSNKEYHGFMIASFYNMIYELDQIYHGVMKHAAELYDFISTQYKTYLGLAVETGVQVKTSTRLASFKLFESDIELIRDRINYYIECRKIPMDIVKTFYSYGNFVTEYQIEDQTDIVNEQIETLQNLSEKLVKMLECMVDENDNCLFSIVSNLAIDIEKAEGNNNIVMDMMDGMIEEINKVEKFINQMFGMNYSADRKMMEEIYHKLLIGSNEKHSSEKGNEDNHNNNNEQIVFETQNSFEMLLEYAEIDPEISDEMKKVMINFVEETDKTSNETAQRQIRSQLSKYFYELYEKIFIKAYVDENKNLYMIPKIVDMFLKYGFADERLLEEEQIVYLYNLKDEKIETDCHIYNIKEWLTLIYEGKKEPSKNEFDLEYPEMVAGLRKQNKLTESEAKEWLQNARKKLNYEIQNMFRYNNRLVNGQISSFVPVLHKEQMLGKIERLSVTKRRVEDTIKEIMKIDYSVFDREALYVDKEKNIYKEYIMKRVYPDIILMPTAGINGVMWQEISGKRRDSAGRFMLPIFADIDLTLILVRVLGKFRWELCRCIEGAAWNDIKQKSLTSEYSDYLQFYRKNKELSEEKKEKLKHQIQKGRGNSREVFTIDYEQWVTGESIGVLRLNKIVRELMATYCPFSKEIRDRLNQQPLFQEAMARYFRQKQKKVREIEGRHRMLLKDQIELTPELIYTLDYHKEL